MKLTGTACAEAMSGAEKGGTKERAEDNAGGVRVERRVREKIAGEHVGLANLQWCLA